MIKAFSDLEIFLVTASKCSRYSWKKKNLPKCLAIATVETILVVARNISRFSQHELRKIARFFTCARLLCFKCGHYNSVYSIYIHTVAQLVESWPLTLR